MQKLYISAKSDTLSALLDIAKIQSTKASNRIEGIYTSDERLHALVMESDGIITKTSISHSLITTLVSL